MYCDNNSTSAQDLRSVSCEVPKQNWTIKDNLAETMEQLHIIEGKVDAIRRHIWAKEDSTPEKDLEIVDMDSNIVHNLDVARRINVKLERIMTGLGL